MAYSLQYGSSRFDKKRKLKMKPAVLLCGILLAAAVGLQLLFPAQMASFRKHALPFLEPDVKQAFAEMTADIQAGQQPKDAVAAFCREIIGEETHSN